MCVCWDGSVCVGLCVCVGWVCGGVCGGKVDVCGCGCVCGGISVVVIERESGENDNGVLLLNDMRGVHFNFI